MSDSDLADEEYCYLTTTGRSSGEPRITELWFGLVGDTVYLLAGARETSQWVKNLQRQSEVGIRVGERLFAGLARTVSPNNEEDARARRLLFEKYRARYSGDLESWRQTALPIPWT